MHQFIVQSYAVLCSFMLTLALCKGYVHQQNCVQVSIYLETQLYNIYFIYLFNEYISIVLMETATVASLRFVSFDVEGQYQTVSNRIVLFLQTSILAILITHSVTPKACHPQSRCHHIYKLESFLQMQSAYEYYHSFLTTKSN